MNEVTRERYTRGLKEQAHLLGFDFCGVARAEFLEEEAPRLEAWLQQGQHGAMRYMENHFDKRLDPTQLVPGAKSVVTLLYNYYPEEDVGQSEDCYKIAKYAYGEDYHFVIKRKLRELLQHLQEDRRRSRRTGVRGLGSGDGARLGRTQWHGMDRKK